MLNVKVLGGGEDKELDEEEALLRPCTRLEGSTALIVSVVVFAVEKGVT